MTIYVIHGLVKPIERTIAKMMVIVTHVTEDVRYALLVSTDIDDFSGDLRLLS